jgi:hypothetical protein
MDTTLIAFSATGADYILVEGTPQEINDKLVVSNRAGSGLVQLTQLPDESKGQRFQPAPVFVNPERIAYIRPPAAS